MPNRPPQRPLLVGTIRETLAIVDEAVAAEVLATGAICDGLLDIEAAEPDWP